jgi:prephenate dehydratase
MRDAAAVGLAESARKMGLPVVAENIQDDVSQTRFVAISKKPAKGRKTSIIFALSDQPGALYGILEVFADRGINLTKIESRPSRRKLGEYLFFMDFENKNADVARIIGEIKPKTTFLKVLGSY